MAIQQVPTHYCDTYGFDEQWRQARLALLNLTTADAALGECLRELVIQPNVDAIVSAFYAKLSEDAESRVIIDRSDRALLAHRQTDYLLKFGVDFDSVDYFEDRLRIGLVHAWVGVPLGLYLCSYQVLLAEILRHIEQVIPSIEQCRFGAFINKIAALDTSLASEVYHIAQMRHLESSVSRLRDERIQLRHAAGTDALTGLANRASLLPHLSQSLAVAVRNEQPLCVIMADLDRFKLINDTHGHQVGDQVLRDTAVRLRTSLRDFDMVGRYGGEEFVTVLQNTPLEVARQVAERVRQQVGGHPYNVVGSGLKITISQGLALAHAGDSVDSLIERADAALYAAKEAGRNCVKIADDPDAD